MLKLPYPFLRKLNSISLSVLFKSFYDEITNLPILKSQGNRPLKMEFEEQFKILVYFHLQGYDSMRDLIQVLKEDDFAKAFIAPKEGIEKSSFSEAINSRGLEQMELMYKALCKRAKNLLPQQNSKFGNLIAIDGTLINAVLSMFWADYSKNLKKAKAHFGFDLNSSIPRKVFLTKGKDAERPFANKIISSDETGVMDRGYQSNELFDKLQEENKKFVCRIKNNTIKTSVSKNSIEESDIVFFDEEVFLGNPNNKKQAKKSVRVVGYKADGSIYHIATNRRDLPAEDIATIYKLRWEIEKFFSWWKRHLKVYHLIARSEYGLMMQIYAGLCTYLLLAIYCHEEHGEKVSIKRVRELRNKINNELRASMQEGYEADNDIKIFKEQKTPN